MPKKKSPSTVVSKDAVEIKVDPAASVEKENKARASRTRSHSVRSQKVAPEVASAPMTAPVATPYEDLQQEIARLAYHFWEEGGRQHGGSVDDWLKAERSVLERMQS